jgi:hypothetical protein
MPISVKNSPPSIAADTADGPALYGTSPIKRARATKAEIEHRYEVLVELAYEYGPCSVRHLYYQATIAGLVPKTNSGSRKTGRALLALRRSGDVPYRLITDSTRWMRKPASFDSLEAALANTAATYRRDLWGASRYQLEVWCESASIAGTIADTTERWDVPLMVCRGFSSETFAYNAAEEWKTDDRLPVVLYVGDHDPAGIEIERTLEERLGGFYSPDDGIEAAAKKIGVPPNLVARVHRIHDRAPDLSDRIKSGALTIDEAELELFGAIWPDDARGVSRPFVWERVAVTWDQVEQYELHHLGSKPKKPYGFPLAFEAEALRPDILIALLDDKISSYVDQHRLAVLEAAEDSERTLLRRMASREFIEQVAS